jgi:RelA/SpoT family (p)ppGpp synthetase
MDIYAPLAERIGMYEMMTEMQTLAFKELEPDAFASVTRRLNQLTEQGGDLVSRIGLGLQLYLADNGLKAEVIGRQKHPFSIWKKMAERHISFEQLSDVMAFRIIVDNEADCYRALGLIHGRWPMVPGRFKDYISTPKRNGYSSLHTSVIHDSKMRIEIQIRSREMHEQAERGLAAHWAYKEGKPSADIHVPWVDDLVEILEHAESPEELLEHTRMAMYQDRIFAFTPKGELIQLPKGATPVDFAYAVHTDLGDRTVGAKVNGRVVPLRTMLENGDQVEILASEAQHPQPSWLRFVATGKARAGVRRFVRHKEREETIELGRKIYDEIVARLPAELDKDALKRALKKLKIENQDELMIAIARKRASDEALMEALMPGSAGGDVTPRPIGQKKAISIKGLTPGVAYHLAQCCHPIPGDRIVGLRREDEEIEVHVIGCDTLASGIDADWLDLAWGEGSDGGAARLAVILRDIPGALGTMSGILGAKHANIINLQLVHRDGSFQTFHLDVEVHDLAHLHSLLARCRLMMFAPLAPRIPAMVPNAPGTSRRMMHNRAVPPSDSSPQARSSQSASTPVASWSQPMTWTSMLSSSRRRPTMRSPGIGWQQVARSNATPGVSPLIEMAVRWPIGRGATSPPLDPGISASISSRSETVRRATRIISASASSTLNVLIARLSASGLNAAGKRATISS